jgi:Cu(I)/Ag(I) efflux system protein CusF
MQMAHAGHNDAHGTGTVNSVDPAQHKVNLSHNPIPEIGWPAMTMEFPVARQGRRLGRHDDDARVETA